MADQIEIADTMSADTSLIGKGGEDIENNIQDNVATTEGTIDTIKRQSDNFKDMKDIQDNTSTIEVNIGSVRASAGTIDEAVDDPYNINDNSNDFDSPVSMVDTGTQYSEYSGSEGPPDPTDEGIVSFEESIFEAPLDYFVDPNDSASEDQLEDFVDANEDPDENAKDEIENKGFLGLVKTTLMKTAVGRMAASLLRRKRRPTFPFERLPLEIRQRIYYYLVPDRAAIRCARHGQLRESSKNPPHIRSFGIARVSKAIRAEVLADLAMHTEFFFDATNIVELSNRFNVLPVALLTNLRRLDIYVHEEGEILEDITALAYYLGLIDHIDELTLTVPTSWLTHSAFELLQRLGGMMVKGKVHHVFLSTPISIDVVRQQYSLPYFLGGEDFSVLLHIGLLTVEDGTISFSAH